MKFSTLLQYVTPGYRTILLILLLLGISSGLSLLNPYLAGKLTGVLLEESIDPVALNVTTILLIWLTLFGLSGIVNFTSDYLVGITGESMLTGLRTRVYEHMQVLPMRHHHDQQPGQLLSLLTNDADTVGDFVTSTLVQVFPALLIATGAILMMALIDPVIAIVILVFMPLYYLIVKITGRKIRPLSTRWYQSYADMVARFEENLGLLPVIKSFSREPLESARFDKRNQQLLKVSGQSLLVESLFPQIARFAAAAGLLLLLWISSHQLTAGEISVSDIVSLLFYALLLNSPLSSIADLYGTLQHTRGAAERLLAFFSEATEPQNTGRPDIGKLSGHITFEAVEFAYPHSSPILTGLNLDIRPRETVAITGENGSGKSTVAYLLMRFADPQSGRILLDDKDISEVTLSSVRREVGLVAQHVLLVNGTIADNIGFGRANATMEEIEQAAMKAHAADFIQKFPQGYDTVIGDQGVKLSGGQRQRLSLARTLLKDPPILILDEATAMFDPEGESAFLDKDNVALKEKTVILITHRPASLRLADRILKMEHGQLKRQPGIPR